MRYKIRNLRSNDVDALIVFFVKAYGKQTPFRSKTFLKWYFKLPRTPQWEKQTTWIALDNSGSVVSHYGCLAYDLIMKGKQLSIMWGVNAFTLPDWRGKGINSEIVEQLTNVNEINGVIGFTKATADYYQNSGYNIFSFERFKRYIYVLSEAKTKKVVRFIEQDVELFNELSLTKQEPEIYVDTNSIIKICRDNLRRYKLSLDYTKKVTTLRDHEYLMWRFMGNPFVNYQLFACMKDNSVQALVVCRFEQLKPLPYKACRIVDLYGSEAGVRQLITYIKSRAKEMGCIYIDFSKAGNSYENILRKCGFISLENENCALLPQISSPIGQRPNNEYFGLQSKNYSAVIKRLSSKDIYFTRADSDRDRLGNVSGPISGWKDND
jgi:hypothetical protein